MSELPLPSRYDVPKPLVQVRQWVNWHVTTPNGRKPTKEPCNSSGRPIDAHDAANHLSFNAARSLAKKHGLGVGYVLTTDDPYTAFDLDDCITDGTIHPAAWKIVEGCNSYTEVTPSGNGLRIFIEGVKLEGSRSVSTRAPWGGRLEVYSTGRYLTITGQHLEGTPLRIQPAPSFLRSIEQKYLGDGSEPGTGLGTALVHDGTDGARPRHDVLRDAAASMIVKGVPEKAVLAGVIAVGRALGLEKDRGARTFLAECRAAVKSAAKFETADEKAITRERQRRLARRVVDAEEANLTLPPAPTLTLEQELAQPEEPEAFAIDELALEDGNVLIPALRKAGKTTLIFNVVKSLVDGDNFLGRFEVRPLEGSAVVLSYEMLPKASRRWMGKLGVARQDQVRFWHLRGWSLPFWLPDVMEYAAEQLKSWGCEALLIDSAGAASAGLVKNFNDRAQVTAFTTAIDELKRRAGVRECYMLVHMGWAAVGAQDDQAHTLGSEAWEAWADMIWPYEKDKDKTMMLRPFGRLDDEPPSPFSVRWDKRTNRLTAGAEREEHREVVGVRAACEAMARLPEWCTSTELRDEMHGLEKDDRSPLIQAAEDRGLIERREKGRAKLCRLTDAGRAMVSAGVHGVRRAE